MPGYAAIVTMDATLSARIGVRAAHEDAARDAILEIAHSVAAERLFALDEGNFTRPYLGDPDGVEEIDEETLAELQSAMGIGVSSAQAVQEESLRARWLIQIVAQRLESAQRLLSAGDAAAAMDGLFGGLALGDLEGLPSRELQRMAGG